MASTSDFRNGLTIKWNGELWTIIEFQHVKPGKGPSFVRTKLRNVRSGRVNDNTFRAGEKVETARVERHAHQYLYEDDFGLHFMNTDTYEQTTIPSELVSGREYIKEGANIDILIYAETGEALATELPKTVELMVVETDPELKGDTAQGGSKPAKLESGATVNVPLFINEGDVIRVNIEAGDYLTRVNSSN